MESHEHHINCLLPHTFLVLILVIWCAQARGRLKCICKLFEQFPTLRSFLMPNALISNLAPSLLVRYIVQSYSYLFLNINCRSHNCRLLLQKRFDLVTKFGKISAQPHPTLCIQFLNRENNDKNNTFPLGKQICFTIVWGSAETLPKILPPNSPL